MGKLLTGKITISNQLVTNFLRLPTGNLKIMKIQIVDENDNPIEYCERDDLDEKSIYRVSYLWITDTDKKILLARRALSKIHDPGKWGPAVAGTVEAGQTYEENIIKEAEEELGLKNIKPVVGKKEFMQTRWKYFSQEFLLTLPVGFSNFKLAEDEVAEIRWFSEDELKKEVEKNSNDFLQGVQRRFQNKN